MSTKKLSLIFALALVIGIYLAFDLGQYLDLQTLKAQRENIAGWRAAHPALALLLYFGVYVLATALSLPGAVLLTLAGGAVFGLLWGTLIISFASSIGATAAFMVSRYALRDLVSQRCAPRLAAIDAGVRREGAFYLFTLRLVPVFPFFLINLLFGLTAMKARTFYWVSQLGMLAGTVVYVNAGTQLGQIDSLSGIVSPALLASFALLGIFPLIARRIIDSARANAVYAGWKKPRRFDRNLIVIGAGSAGLSTAYLAAALKARVTLVEKHRMGGDCLTTGCVPSKALIRSARLLSQMARSPEFGIASASARFDFSAVMERVQAVIRAVEPHDSIERYTALGVEVIEGTARIVSPWEVAIKSRDGTIRRLSSRAIVIAAGARPLVPSIAGIDAVGYLTSDTVWDLRELPRRLLVLGGGPIGAELAQAFARFGAQVTILDQAPRILPGEDPEVSDAVSRRFIAEGITLCVDHQASQFVIEDGKKILIAVHQGRDVRLDFDTLLVAAGRSANLSGYGLDEMGIATGQTIATNDFLQTRFPNIYAAGDVAGPFQLTHAAAHQAGYAAVNALFSPFRRFKADYSVIPRATFVEPEVARVGLNEQDARQLGVAFETSVFAFDDLDRAIADGEANGFIKVLTVPGKDRILGVTIVGEHAGDLIAEYVLAMKQSIGLNKILTTIHIYPTLAEANKYVAGVWKRAHSPKRLLAWVERFHRWRRG
jgi:pyruvate/2-oxoglutarate dehydrogenase complex dihydrolipoamide dehydrogenase (E3) component/uncharacterized membrane protein YdjX (TVP38/TMEM64 family)